MAMEAAPRLPMLSMELKAPHEAPAFKNKLKQYIAECYREDPESYNNEIHQLEGLRAAAVRPAIDLTGIAALKRYFCQLRGLQSRFPMSKGQPVAVSFAWKDLFANIVCTLADIRFEMVCILYNIGALHSKLGAAETRTTPDSMKAACTHFQTAAWAFQHLKEHYPQPSGVDLSPEIMKLFHDICIAQAQECIMEKGMQDSRKAAIVGAIGMQTIQHYKNAVATLSSTQSSDNLYETVGLKICNAWHKSLSFKISYISSIVYLFQGMQSEQLQRMGERVAYYQLACDKLQEAKKLSKGLTLGDSVNDPLTFTNDVVEGKRKAAKNENEFIYHEKVPDANLLSEPKPAPLAKGMAINFNDPEVSGPDIFGRLVPMRAHEASSMYSEEKAKLLRKISSEVELKDTQLNEFMSSLQLDELNILNEPERLPQELVDICASLSVKTDAIQNLIDTMSNLNDIHTEVDTMLADIKNIIEVEETSEKEFQQIIGKRPPSIVSTELSREANKYLEAHNKANESNQTLHKAMSLHLSNLKILCLPLDELQKHIPSLESVRGTIDSSAMSDMRSLVEKVNEMRAQRSMLVLQLRDAVNGDDITSQLLTRTGESLDEIFKQEIEKHNKTVNLINQNMLAQENILKALTEAYAKYAPSRKMISDINKKKESFFTAMKTSYETYEDLLKKSLKGIEFYRKLSSTVSRLLSRLKSICNVQQEERSQHLKNHSVKSGIPSSTKTSSISSIPTSTSTSNVKDEVSTGPKLKDFLPYMKNRNNIQQPHISESIEPSFAGHMYPPYVRPAPVGSDGKNETMLPNYADPSYNLKQQILPDSDAYKSYLPYNAGMHGIYSDQNPHVYNVDQYPDPKSFQNLSYSGYYPYSSSAIEENPKTSIMGDNLPNKNFDANSKDFNEGYLNYQGNPISVSQYGQTVPPASAYLNTAGPNVYNPNFNMMAPNQQTATIGTNVIQDPYYQHPINYSNASQVVHPDASDYNKLSSQMQNMNISTSVPAQSYGNFYANNASIPSNHQIYDPSIQYQIESGAQMNMYPNQQPIENLPINSQNNYNINNSSVGVLPNQQYPDMSINNQTTSYPSDANQVSNYQGAVTVNLNAANNMQNPYMSQVSTDAINLSSQQMTPVIDKLNPQVQLEHAYQNYPAIQNPQNVVHPTEDFQNTTFNQQVPIEGLPIQSHVHRDFLPKDVSNVNHTLNFDANTYNYGSTDVTIPTNENNSQQFVNYSAGELGTNNSYQNHPGYGFNNKTGIYDYNYGYQNSTQSTAQPVMSISQSSQENQYQPNLYTNAGQYATVQTSSQTPVNPEPASMTPDGSVNAQYYSLPYGYQSVNSNETPQPVQINNNEPASNEQPTMNGKAGLTYMNSNDTTTTTTYSDQGKTRLNTSTSIDESNEDGSQTADVSEPSTIDLLTGLDFSIEQTPLMPEIRVPPVSEYVIRKAQPRDYSESKSIELITPDEDEPSLKPPKRDIFSDPGLLNKFTQEVKSMQQFVDSFTKKTHSGITMLDSKWKKIHEIQAKENHLKTMDIAKNNMDKNASPDVVTYDDSRVKLVSEYCESYINASHVKQISPWCIPLILSDLPSEENYATFWHMVFQQKISSIVCLLTEIELQGKFYGPTSKNQKLEFAGLTITLDEITCNVNWTERKLTVMYKNTEHKIVHFQINVFPARVVSSPLVMLVDKVLNTICKNDIEDNDLPKTLVHCNTGAGRSALIILLTMVMCQVRAGYIDLRDMLDCGFLYLCGVRTNVLEDTKYLVDIYRTVLFYVQGVLCSGTVLFNGEAVSVQSGASIPPPHIAPHTRKSDNYNKFTKESFEEMKQAAGLKSGDMQDPLSYLDPLWSLKKRKD